MLQSLKTVFFCSKKKSRERNVPSQPTEASIATPSGARARVTAAAAAAAATATRLSWPVSFSGAPSERPSLVEGPTDDHEARAQEGGSSSFFFS